ncbi:MAG: DUF996 domain-containing protein [Candidatus Bathyarchaeota archaeon]|nr:DUF996 domain-containing protein [Candidatus Termiticorpusculum sp.]
MSLESAKKHGFIASMINFVGPVLLIVAATMIIVQFFAQFIGGQGVLGFWIEMLGGFIIGVGVAGIIGFILFLLSMYRLSKYYNEPKIFRYILFSVLFSAIYGIITIITMYYTIVPAALTATDPFPNFSTIMGSIMHTFSILFVVATIMSILNGVLYWQAFTKLGEKSDVNTFNTAGLLYLIGSITSITGIGIIIAWLAWIFAAQAYRKIQPLPTFSTPSIQPITTEQSNFNTIYCSYCGIKNNTDNTYCKYCGQPLQTHQTNP